jgi:hypothetical protein
MINLEVKIYTVIFVWDMWVYSQISVSCFLSTATIIKTFSSTDNNYSADDLK